MTEPNIGAMMELTGRSFAVIEDALRQKSVFNRTSGIEYRYGGDGYAANSKSRYTGPVGFPNQIENPTKSALLW